MPYNELAVFLLNSLTAEKDGSANSTIAAYILENPEEMSDIGIKELAERCHVGIASVSRFCRDMGISDFSVLRGLLKDDSSGSSLIEEKDMIGTYRDSVTEAINLAASSVDGNKLRTLCEDIRKYKKVAVFGLFKAEQAAMLLHDELILSGKKSYTKLPFAKQMEYIEKSDENDLIIIFSYTGVYFDYRYRKLPESFKKPKIWMISGGQNKYRPFVNEFIHFDSKLDSDSHPYQLQFIAGLIAKEYGK